MNWLRTPPVKKFRFLFLDTLSIFDTIIFLVGVQIFSKIFILNFQLSIFSGGHSGSKSISILPSSFPSGFLRTKSARTMTIVTITTMRTTIHHGKVPTPGPALPAWQAPSSSPALLQLQIENATWTFSTPNAVVTWTHFLKKLKRLKTYRKFNKFKTSKHISRRALFAIVVREKMTLLRFKNAQAGNVGDFHGHNFIRCIRSDGEKESIDGDDVGGFAKTNGFRLPEDWFVGNVFDANGDDLLGFGLTKF